MDKPATAAGYSVDWLEHARGACLYVATVLGDLLLEDLVVVGGLVPSLIIAQDPPEEGVSLHPGTMDLDLGLSVGVLDGARYAEIAKRLRESGFEVTENQAGNRVLQTWRVRGGEGRETTVDFLIAPSSVDDQANRIKHLEADFGAVVTPGLELAFKDRIVVTMDGRTIMGEAAVRDVPVCGPGAFVVLKALAFRSRGQPKDAFDLYYTLRNFADGLDGISDRVKSLMPDDQVTQAMEILRADFHTAEALGPVRAARFNGNEADDPFRADVVGFVAELLGKIDG